MPKTKLVSVNTVPQMDAFYRFTGVSTVTVLVFDPVACTIVVEQRNDPRCATMSAREWRGYILTALIAGHPIEQRLQFAIEQLLPLFDIVADGWMEEYDGQTFATRLTDLAKEAWQTVQDNLASIDSTGWSFVHVADWIGQNEQGLITMYADRIARKQPIDWEVEGKKIEHLARSRYVVVHGVKKYMQFISKKVRMI